MFAWISASFTSAWDLGICTLTILKLSLYKPFHLLIVWIVPLQDEQLMDQKWTIIGRSSRIF